MKFYSLFFCVAFFSMEETDSNTLILPAKKKNKEKLKAQVWFSFGPKSVLSPWFPGVMLDLNLLRCSYGTLGRSNVSKIRS